MKPLLLPMLAASLCTSAVQQTEDTDVCTDEDSKGIDMDIDADGEREADYEAIFGPFVLDVSWFDQWMPRVPIELTDRDYQIAADALGVELATIRAVVEIEAGSGAHGFWTEGKPLICFSTNLFQRYAKAHGISTAKYAKSHAVVFNQLNISRYGSHQAAHQAKYDAACEIDESAAIQGTFWGMFQIGGFNWKRCGTESPQEFAEKMQRSERDQLQLFINFLQSTGLDKALQDKNWAVFARGYNGPSYASRGYHTRLAKYYNKYK